MHIYLVPIVLQLVMHFYNMYFRVWCLAHCCWRVVHRCSSGCRSETSMQSRRFARTPYWEVISARVGYSNMLPSISWLYDSQNFLRIIWNAATPCRSASQRSNKLVPVPLVVSDRMLHQLHGWTLDFSAVRCCFQFYPSDAISSISGFKTHISLQAFIIKTSTSDT